MKFIDQDKLPLEIKNNELPREKNKHYKALVEDLWMLVSWLE